MSKKTVKPAKKPFTLTFLSEVFYCQPKTFELLLQDTHKQGCKVHNVATIAANNLNHRDSRATDAHSSAGVCR